MWSHPTKNECCWRIYGNPNKYSTLGTLKRLGKDVSLRQKSKNICYKGCETKYLDLPDQSPLHHSLSFLILQAESDRIGHIQRQVIIRKKQSES